MEKLALSELAGALGLTWSGDEKVRAICTDTRILQEDCLFVALKGERFDGHNYTRQALESGALAVLTEKDTGCGEKEIRVRSTAEALVDLAAWYRRRFKPLVVGITGSVGKTTTKEMIAAVLGRKYKTLKNEGNLNNEIGLPITLFGLDSGYEAAVFEMGMNHFGEIERLSKMTAPHVGVITNIGVSHIENLGSRENILAAKSEIMAGMERKAPLIVNGDDPYLQKINSKDHKLITFGIDNETCDFRAEILSKAGDTASFYIIHKNIRQKIDLPTMGKHNIYNALAAFTVGHTLGVNAEEAGKALALYSTQGMRQRIMHRKDYTFIEDCYNSSPDSVKAALDVLTQHSSERRIAVLGDMLELGSYADRAHEDVGEEVVKSALDALFVYGDKSKLTAQKAKDMGLIDVFTYDSKNELADDLLAYLKAGDTILFKASRGMRLEDVIDIIYGGLESDE